MLNDSLDTIKYLKKNYRNKFYFAFFLNLISTTFQVIGFSFIFVLLEVVINDNQSTYLNFLENYLKLDLTNNDNIIVILSTLIAILFIVGTLIRFYTQFYNLKFSELIKNNLQKTAYENILNINLKKFYLIPKAKISNIVGLYVDRIKETCGTTLNILNNFILISISGAYILYLNYSGIIVIIFFLFFFLLIYFLLKKWIATYSAKQTTNLVKIASINHKIFFGLRDILLLDLRHLFIKMLNLELLKRKSIIINISTLSSIPKYLIELIIVIFFLIYLNYLFLDENLKNNLPIIGTFLVMSLRLMPLFSATNRDFLILKKNSFVSNNFYKKKIELLNKKNTKLIKKISHNNWQLRKGISVEKVKFYYERKKKFLFDYKFKVNDWHLVVGNSGAGKSTFFDLLSGLLIPNSGNIFYDKINISKNTNLIQKRIGYVTQDPLLFDGSLLENITFEKEINKKNEKLLKKISQIVGLDKIANFNSLSKTKIDIQAKTLSGGQRQRIALARILFKQPQILILDESLNALDSKSVVKIFQKLRKYFKLTLFYSSHHPLKFKFDRILRIN